MKHVKAVVTLLFANAISLFAAAADDEKIPVSFDQAFPTTWYKKALDACMHVWAELDVVRVSGDTILPEDLEHMLHAAVGRMVYATTCLERLCIDKKQVVPAEDLLYLGKVADTIEQRVRSVIADGDEQGLCFKRMLNQLRHKLKLLITKQ